MLSANYDSTYQNILIVARATDYYKREYLVCYNLATKQLKKYEFFAEQLEHIHRLRAYFQILKLGKVEQYDNYFILYNYIQGYRLQSDESIKRRDFSLADLVLEVSDKDKRAHVKNVCRYGSERCEERHSSGGVFYSILRNRIHVTDFTRKESKELTSVSEEPFDQEKHNDNTLETEKW